MIEQRLEDRKLETILIEISCIDIVILVIYIIFMKSFYYFKILRSFFHMIMIQNLKQL